jgi:hypothetical protein
VTVTDAEIRWAWTILTGFGVCFAVWNVKEVLIDNWAVSQIRTRPLDVLRLQTRSAVYDHALIAGALTTDFMAGICALLGISTWALVMLMLSAGLLIVLSFTQTQRRRRIFRALQHQTAVTIDRAEVTGTIDGDGHTTITDATIRGIVTEARTEVEP